MCIISQTAVKYYVHDYQLAIQPWVTEAYDTPRAQKSYPSNHNLYFKNI